MPKKYMKQLQHNYTTPEQSKRLMDLGVPVDSADCIRTLYKRNGDDKQIDVLIEPYSSTKRSDINRNEMEQYPCWSVGRLMEIYLTCALDYHPYDDFYTETPSLHFMAFDKDRLINEIISIISEDEMDFSKLEE